MKWLSILILFFTIAPAFADEVTTTDGHTFDGYVRLDGTQISVKTNDREIRLDPANIVHAAFSLPKGVSPVAPENTEPAHGLKGEYFNNAEMKNPLLTRLDPQLDCTWQDGIPDPLVPERFWARWTGQLTAPRSGTYTFSLAHDDGARVWIDDKLVIDVWKPGEGTDMGTIDLVQGQPVSIRVEFFNAVRTARVILSWSMGDSQPQVVGTTFYTPPPGFAPAKREVNGGWFATYYRDKYLTVPLFTRIDPCINFDWRTIRPDPRLDHTFSACWIAELTPPRTDRYIFRANSKDGVRLSIDGKILIDRWRTGPSEGSARIQLEGGKRVLVVVSFYNDSADPNLRLIWSCSTFRDQLITPDCLTPATPEQRRQLLKPHGLRGEYFDDENFKTVRFRRHDPDVDFNWPNDPQQRPDPRLPEKFAARWTGRLLSPGDGQYKLFFNVDDVGRVSIDGTPIIDCWDQHSGEYSASFTFRAGQTYELKVEFSNRQGADAAAHLSWAGPNLQRQIIDPSYLTPPSGDAGSEPQVVLKPLSKPFFGFGETVVLSADISTGDNDHIRRVDFFADGHPIGTANQAPYFIDWKKPMPGRYNVTAVAIDENGYQGTSAKIPVTIIYPTQAGLGGGWMYFHVGTPPLVPENIHADAGTFNISAGAGDLFSATDSFNFIFHQLDGDGELTVHLNSIKANATDNLASAGIIVRSDLSPGSTNAGILLVNSNNPAAAFVHRDVADVAVDSTSTPAQAPFWLRIQRIGNLFDMSTSVDGQHWKFSGESTLQTTAPVLIGLAVTAKDDGPATAIFDNVNLQLARTKPAVTLAAGVETLNGSILAGEIISADTDRIVLKFRGQNVPIKTAQAARLLFHAIPADMDASTAPGKRGVLLANGDFADGDFSDLTNGHVNISSVLFGKQSFKTTDGILAVLLNDPKPTPGYTITARDGSIYRVNAIKIEVGKLQITDPAAGEISLTSEQIKTVVKAE